MLTRKTIAVMIVAVLLYACTAQAIIVQGPFAIGPGDNYNKIEAHDPIDPEPWWPPEWRITTIDMTGGSVGDGGDENSGMFTYDSSTANISGGTVAYLHTYNSSTANISGGAVGNWHAWSSVSGHDSSTFNVYEGAFLTGGSFSSFDLYNSSTLNVYGGGLNLFVLAHNSGIVNVYGGDLFELSPYDYSTINVYGGYIRIFYENIFVPETATINIYGYDFNYYPEVEWRYWDDPADGWWVTKLTGIGFDGTPITYWGLPDPYTNPNINLIPEPGTLCLFALGGLVLLRKRRGRWIYLT